MTRELIVKSPEGLIFQGFLLSKLYVACHAELVEAWWGGLCARSFDKLRMTGLLLV
jgi:hypothetical protein